MKFEGPHVARVKAAGATADRDALGAGRIGESGLRLRPQ
jgi:hypothetical protein